MQAIVLSLGCNHTKSPFTVYYHKGMLLESSDIMLIPLNYIKTAVNTSNMIQFELHLYRKSWVDKHYPNTVGLDDEAINNDTIHFSFVPDLDGVPSNLV